MFEIESTMNNNYVEQMASAGNKDRKREIFFLSERFGNCVSMSASDK